MKKIVLLSVICLSVNSVCAANIFENNNPFPQTTPQTMNNLYEAEPATIQKEVKQEKKSWFRKGKNLKQQEAQEQARQNLNTYPVNEGAQNSESFYIFK